MIKMWRAVNGSLNNLGRWMYEHAHCAGEWNDDDAGFTRFNELHFINDGMQDWTFPLTNTSCNWLEQIADIEVSEQS